MSKIKCNCQKCLKLEDENGIENLKRCEFCGHYFIDWRDGSGHCECKEGQNKKKILEIKDINQFEMFKELLDYANDSGLYDCFDDLEIEWNEIVEKTKEWKSKVEKTYNNMKKEGLIK